MLQNPLSRVRTGKKSVQSLATRFLNLPCLRGIDAWLKMSVAQWYLAACTDFLLSGQPDGLQMGYGSSYVVIAIFFGEGAVQWTHCAITERSSDYVYWNFLKNGQALGKLVPVTAMWAFSEQMALSLPLAMSRVFGLKDYAFEPQKLSDLSAVGQLLVLMRLLIVYLLYLGITAFVSIPANMILRRVHATMLAADETSIVPYHHANKEISITEAWSTLTWDDYRRVVLTHVQHFILSQSLHLTYWSLLWYLHTFFNVAQYSSPQLPNSPANLKIQMNAVSVWS
ncbi:MAG: hypothetical protein Q9190_003745 [Brigantiaea leucoxantha]